MNWLRVFLQLLNKAGDATIEPRREDGHGSNEATPSFVAPSAWRSAQTATGGDESWRTRRDEAPGTKYAYHGRGPLAADDIDAVWDVLRYEYEDENKTYLVEERFARGIAWADRTTTDLLLLPMLFEDSEPMLFEDDTPMHFEE